MKYQDISKTIVSLFKGVADRNPVERTLNEVLENYTKGNTLKLYTQELHEVLKHKGDAAYKKLKNGKETVCFSGVFKGGHSKKHLQIYNPIMVLDIDKTGEKTEGFLEVLANDPFVMSVWKSPSSNGIKALVFHDGKQGEHERVFRQIAAYFKEQGIKIDPTGKDVSRMCHLSHDANAVIKQEFECFLLLREQEKSEKDEEKREKETFVNSEEDKPTVSLLGAEKSENDGDDDQWFARVISFTENKVQFITGSRNAFVFSLAANCNRWGKEQQVVERLILGQYQQEKDFTKEEIQKAIDSAYQNVQEFGSFETKKTEEKPKNAVQRYKLTEKELNRRYDFRYNVVSGRSEYSKKQKNKYGLITDRFILSLERSLKHANVASGSKMISNIVESNFSKQYDPFEEYLKGLPTWDGKDYVAQLAATVKTTDPEWEDYLRVWLRAAMMCLKSKEVVNHTMLILVGGQGVGKTTWLNNLVPDQLSQYKFVGTINPSNKDSLIHLSECFLINLDELENLNRRDIGVLKSVITLPSVRLRRAYGRHTEELLRRASFAGSINEEHFLTDPTGSRRFLPFKVLSIDYQHKVNIDQVYAQVITECKEGKPCYFNQEQNKKISERNEDFRRLTLEEELLIQFFELPKEGDQGREMSISQIIDHICSYSNYSSSNFHQNNVGRSLKKMGYEQLRNSHRRYYVLRVLPIQGRGSG